MKTTGIMKRAARGGVTLLNLLLLVGGILTIGNDALATGGLLQAGILAQSAIPVTATAAARATNPATPSTEVDATTARSDQLVNLEGVWLFQDGDNDAFRRPEFNDSEWRQVKTPATHRPFSRRFAGYGWYRKHITLGGDDVLRAWALSLGPAREAVEVYFNGSMVAHRGSFGNRPRGQTRYAHLTASLPSEIIRRGDNVLAVRVYDPSWNCGLPAGPLLLGDPMVIQAAVRDDSRAPLMLRLASAALALVLAGAVLVLRRFWRSQPGAVWLVLAGAALAGYLADGTGVFAAVVTPADVAIRLPIVLGHLAILCLMSFFIESFGPLFSGRFHWFQWGLLAQAALVLLLPNGMAFNAAQVCLLAAALSAGFVAVRLMGQSVRRREPAVVPLFAAVVTVVILAVNDAVTWAASSSYPPSAALGMTGLLGMIVFTNVRQLADEYSGAVRSSVELSNRFEGVVSSLDAAVMSVTRPRSFLQAVVHEVSRELEVRRCALLLALDDETLYIVASKGLPTHAHHDTFKMEETVFGWVFTHGTPTGFADEPASKTKTEGHEGSLATYLGEDFVAQPVRYERTLGVLVIADRQSGARFTSTADRERIETVANRLALALTRVGALRIARNTMAPGESLSMHLLEETAPQSVPHADEKSSGGQADAPTTRNLERKAEEMSGKFAIHTGDIEALTELAPNPFATSSHTTAPKKGSANSQAWGAGAFENEGLVSPPGPRPKNVDASASETRNHGAVTTPSKAQHAPGKAAQQKPSDAASAKEVAGENEHGGNDDDPYDSDKTKVMQTPILPGQGGTKTR
jgi:hypothetical protein